MFENNLTSVDCDIKDGRVDRKSDGYVQGYKGKKEADSKMKR